MKRYLFATIAIVLFTTTTVFASTWKEITNFPVPALQGTTVYRFVDEGNTCYVSITKQTLTSSISCEFSKTVATPSPSPIIFYGSTVLPSPTQSPVIIPQKSNSVPCTYIRACPPNA